MAKVKIKRGLEANIGNVTLDDGEFAVTTDTKKLFIGIAGAKICLGGASSLGDMLKSIYDTDNDGIVDAAEVADSVPWAGVTGKPSAFTPSTHTHTKSQISDFPTSLPANGGNADTVDGIHSTGFGRAYSASYSFGGAQAAITTEEFVALLSSLGAFSQPYWVARGSWSYANNKYISDTGLGNIHLAGATIEVIGTSSTYTIRIHTPTTSSGVSNPALSTEFVYINNGSTYSPGWRKIWNSSNDGAESGLDADLLDGKHAAEFVKKGATWNDLKGV